MTLFKCQMYLARTALIGDTFQIELEFRNFFERYLKNNNYGFSIMKDAEFEQARKALQSKQKDLKQKGKGWWLVCLLLSFDRDSKL